MNVVAWRLRCRYQQRALSVFLIERFHGYRTPNLRRLPFLWLDRDGFANLFDGDRLSNLWTGLCRLGSRRIHACRVASGTTVGLIESYGSLSVISVGLFMATGMTSLRFTASSARGKSLEPISRARRARGSPWMLQSSVGACACVAISM